jgi:hypothetical protein
MFLLGGDYHTQKKMPTTQTQKERSAAIWTSHTEKIKRAHPEALEGHGRFAW